MTFKNKYLNIDSDLDVAYSHAEIWKEREIGLDRVDNMAEGIALLISNEYLFVAINGDVVDFMPLLNEMRSVTNIPILIGTSHFDTKTEISALANGADLYARFHETKSGNIESVLAHVTRKTERDIMPCKILVYKNLLVAPQNRSVFIGNEKVDLTRQEFDILHYLMINRGQALSYRQIYRYIWGGEYEDAERHMLWNAMTRLRNKLKNISLDFEYIETVHDYGYRFPLNTDLR